MRAQRDTIRLRQASRRAFIWLQGSSPHDGYQPALNQFSLLAEHFELINHIEKLLAETYNLKNLLFGCCSIYYLALVQPNAPLSDVLF